MSPRPPDQASGCATSWEYPRTVTPPGGTGLRSADDRRAPGSTWQRSCTGCRSCWRASSSPPSGSRSRLWSVGALPPGQPRTAHQQAGSRGRQEVPAPSPPSQRPAPAAAAPGSTPAGPSWALTFSGAFADRSTCAASRPPRPARARRRRSWAWTSRPARSCQWRSPHHSADGLIVQSRIADCPDLHSPSAGWLEGMPRVCGDVFRLVLGPGKYASLGPGWTLQKAEPSPDPTVPPSGPPSHALLSHSHGSGGSARRITRRSFVAGLSLSPRPDLPHRRAPLR
jgi:hypothetical protein